MQAEIFSFKSTLLWFHRADVRLDLARQHFASVWIVCPLPLASGTMSGSWRSGWRRGSWQSAVPRRLWSLSYRLRSFCRSRRRLRPTPKLFAPCVAPWPQLRSVISKCSAFFICGHDMLLVLWSLFACLVDRKSVDVVHPSNRIWRASVNHFHHNY